MAIFFVLYGIGIAISIYAIVRFLLERKRGTVSKPTFNLYVVSILFLVLTTIPQILSALFPL